MKTFALLTWENLATSRISLQQILACLKFTLDAEDCACSLKWKKWFLWGMVAAQAAEIMTIHGAWPDVYDKG